MYPFPREQEYELKKELERVFERFFLLKVKIPEWVDPTFIQNIYNGTVILLSKYKKCNRQIRRKPFPITNIQDVLIKLE